MKIRKLIEEDQKPKVLRFEIPEPVPKDDWKLFFHSASRYLDCDPLPDKSHPAFELYYKLAKARYHQACEKLMEYRNQITNELLNADTFIQRCGEVEREIFNMHKFFRYSQLKQTKDLVKRRTKVSTRNASKPKRSEQMKLLLEENGYRIVDGTVLNARSQELGKFLANGKVEVKDSSRISVHAFLNQ